MYITIEVGGTTLRIAAVSDLTDVHSMQKTHFPLTHDFDKDFHQIIQTIDDVSQGYVQGIGMSVVGNLNESKEFMDSEAPNLKEWLNVPIKRLLFEKYNCPIFIDNDAVVAGLGEAIYGAGKNQSFIYAIWGTGIGGATIQIKNGIYLVHKLNWYDYFEAWEEDCGGNKLKERFGKSGAELSEEEWIEVMNDFKKHLGIFIEKTHPQKIIFGGGIAFKQQKRLLEITKDFPDVTVQIPHLGEDTGLYGGFALLKNSL